MEQLISVAVIIHIIAGALALLTGAIAFALRKNTPKHKPVGKIYFWCMTVVFITAMFVSVYKELVFLFLIGIFTYYSTITAFRSLKLKNLHNGQKPYPIDWFIETVAGIAFISMMGFGIYFISVKNNLGGIIPLVFGIFGVLSVRTNIKILRGNPKETLYWLKKHIGHMMGSYIGAVTAFLVNQTEYIPINPIILWLGPAAIVVPAITMELKKVKSVPIE